MYMKASIACTILFVLLNSKQTMTQRPSFAGSRPGGLNQKDKYHQTQQTPTGGVANRFGASNNNKSENSNSLPYGAAQRPPIGGPVVQPQSQFEPLNVNQQARPQVILDNRISGNDIGGGSDSNANRIGNAGAFPGFAPQPGFQDVPAPAPVNVLPLDARGDQALIDYLNTVPLDQRPFWFLNYQAIEAQRNGSRPAFAGPVGGRGSFSG